MSSTLPSTLPGSVAATPVPAPRAGRLARFGGTLLLAGAVSTALAAPANAHPVAAPAAVTAPAGFTAPAGAVALEIAERYVGVPYLWGGTTPAGFDCSGFTGFVYGQLGIALPRTANEQMLATARVAPEHARPGDLVFFLSPSGRAYHNGVYAGDGQVYDSPRAGRTVSKRAIWTSAVAFHRVGG